MRCAARRLRVPVAAAAIALALVAAAPAGENPASAVARFAGHPSLVHIVAETSRRRDGAAETSSLDVAGSQRLERECRDDLCRGTWFDGARSFAFGINGTPFHERDRDEPALRTFAAIASTAFAEPGFRTAGGEISVATRAGDVRRFRVRAAAGSDLVAVTDGSAARLASVERTDASVFAPLVASGTPPAIVYAPHPFDRVTIATEPLEPPHGPRARLAGPGAVPLLDDALPIVACRLAGVPARCLIDTGTTPSAVSLGFAERLGREPHGTLEIAGLGTFLTGAIEADPLEVGPATIAGLHFAVIPHSHGPDFDVIIGSDVLAALRIELDPARRSARIVPSLPPAVAGSALDIDFERGVPVADVRLSENAAPETFLVDTGDMGTLSIGYDRYHAEPSLFAAREQVVAAGVGGRSMDALAGELARLGAGRLRFERLPIVAVRGQHRGHLGYGFARRCGRLLLDLGAMRIDCAGETETRL